MRYQLLKQGPDDHSTYSECWGNRATSAGRLVMEASRLADLVEAVSALGHSNWCVKDGRTYLSPEEFWARPVVAAAR